MVDFRFILDYLNEIDQSLESLSNHHEKKIPYLTSWVLTTRKITVAQIKDKDFYVVKVIPNNNIDTDILDIKTLSSIQEFNEYVYPLNIDFNMNYFPMPFGIGDCILMKANDPNALPDFEFRGYVYLADLGSLKENFSSEKAKEEAINLWNNTDQGFPISSSFVLNLKNIFTRFQSIIKRKSFIEHRIHRYMNSNPKFLLLSHRVCHFEKALFLNGDKRVADFILQRETGMPALLIELENPCHNLFTKNGSYTKEANHAKSQISEWVRFIDQNPQNSDGDFDFLRGSKQRLVVIGRGLDNSEKMINSRYEDTFMWTYDFLLKEVKDYWNAIIREQCNIIGIENPNLI